MLDEIKKSINSSLYERARSPLYRTFIISWCIWNWKLLYYLLTEDYKKSIFERIDCIKTEITSIWTLLWGPLISTIIILTIIEFVANYTYWLHIYSKTWRVNKKTKTEGKQLLTYEQSIKLRGDIRKKEEEYEKLILEKEDKIKELENELTIINTAKEKNTNTSLTNMEVKNNKIDLLYKKIKTEDKLESFEKICAEILNGIPLNSKDNDIRYFLTIGLITKNRHVSNDICIFDLTKEGKEIHEMLIFRPKN